MNARAWGALIVLGCVGSSSASAQPALERVEKQLRQQAPARPAVPLPAGAAAADGAIQPVPQPGYLGVVADDKQDRGRGARILEIVANSPAAAAGLKVGDLITSINDQNVRELDDMTNILSLRATGSVVLFVVNRDGADRQVPVTLGERPSADKRRLPQFGKQPEDLPAPSRRGGNPALAQAQAPAADGPKLGIRTLPITPDAQRQFRLPNTSGALVTAVGVGSPAERAGIPLGAAITALEGQPVDSPETLAALVRQQTPGIIVDVTCIVRGQELHKRVELSPLASAPPVLPPALPPPLSATRPTPDQPPGFVPQDAVAGASDGARIEALEQRVAELEARIAQLEAAAAGGDK